MTTKTKLIALVAITATLAIGGTVYAVTPSVNAMRIAATYEEEKHAREMIDRYTKELDDVLENRAELEASFYVNR